MRNRISCYLDRSDRIKKDRLPDSHCGLQGSSSVPGTGVEPTKVCMVVKNQLWNDARVKKEALSLSRAGYGVTIVAKSEEERPAEENWKGIRILRPPKDSATRQALRQKIVSAYPPSSTTLQARLVHVIRRNRLRRTFTDLKRDLPWEHRLYRAICSTKADIVHAHDLDTLLVGAAAALKLGAQLVYDSHELWLHSARYLRETDPLNRLRYRLTERILIRRADAVIAVTPSRGRAMESMYPELTGRLTIVENSTEPLNPLPESNLLKNRLNLPENLPVVLYQGILCPERGLEELLYSARLLPEGSAAIVLVGHDAWGGRLQRLHTELGLEDRVHILPPVPSERLPEVTVSADAGLILFQNTCLNHTYSLPNKLYEYMMAGLPILASDLPEIRRVLEDSECGLLLENPSPDVIAREILRLTSSREAMKKMGARGRQAALERYCWPVQAERLLTMYLGLDK